MKFRQFHRQLLPVLLISIGAILTFYLLTNINRVVDDSEAATSDPAPHLANLIAQQEEVRRAVESHNFAVALLLDPSDILMCSKVLSLWKDWAANAPGRLSIFFSGEPSEGEARQLIFHRISGRVLPFSDQLMRSVGYSSAEFLVTEKETWFWRLSRGPQASSQLLSFVRDGTLQGFAGDTVLSVYNSLPRTALNPDL